MGVLAAALLLFGPAQDVASLLLSAEKKLKEGNVDGAIADYTRVLELDPKSADAFSLRGLAREKKSDWTAAEKDYGSAVRINPLRQEDYIRRGAMRRNLKDSEGALRDFEEALKLKPGDAWALYYRGLHHLDRNDPQGAIDDFTRALKDSPDYGVALTERARAYCRLDRNKEAIDDCSLAIKIDPKDVFAWNQRGIAKWQLKDNDGAIGDYSKAILLDPQAAYLWKNRGLAKASKGIDEEAILDFTRSIDLDPADAGSWFSRGSSRRALRDHRGAIADFTRALELKPSAETYRARSESHRLSGNPKGAVEDAKRGLELEPKNPFSYLFRGIALEAQGEIDRAIADFEEGLRLDPADIDCIRERGYCRSILGRWEEGTRDLEAFVKKYPDTFYETQLMIYLNRSRGGDQAAAAGWLRGRLSRWPKDDTGTLEARFLLGERTEGELLGDLDAIDGEIAQYYIGMRLLLKKDLEGAAVAFGRLVSSKARDFRHPAAKAELDRINATPREPITVRNSAPSYSLTIPGGYAASDLLPPKASHAFVRRVVDPSDVPIMIVLQPLGGQIGREEISDADFAALSARAKLPPGAEIRRGKAAWGEHQVPTAESSFFFEKGLLFTIAAQVPLSPESIQIIIGGPASFEAQIRADFQKVLASVSGRTHWRTPLEERRRLTSEIPTLAAWLSFLAYIVCAVTAFREEPLRAWKLRFWWLLGTTACLMLAAVMGAVFAGRDGLGWGDLVGVLLALLTGMLAFGVLRKATTTLALAGPAGVAAVRKDKRPLAPWIVFFLTWFGILLVGITLFQTLWTTTSVAQLEKLAEGLGRLGFFIALVCYFVARTNVRNWEKRQGQSAIRERAKTVGDRSLCKRCGAAVTGSEQVWQKAGYCTETCFKFRRPRPAP